MSIRAIPTPNGQTSLAMPPEIVANLMAYDPAAGKALLRTALRKRDLTFLYAALEAGAFSLPGVGHSQFPWVRRPFDAYETRLGVMCDLRSRQMASMIHEGETDPRLGVMPMNRDYMYTREEIPFFKSVIERFLKEVAEVLAMPFIPGDALLFENSSAAGGARR